MIRLPAAALFLSAIAGATAAHAADETQPAEKAQAETYPFIEAELETTLGNDLVFRSDDPGAEINDFYPEAALALRFGLTPNLSVNAGLTLEPVLDPTPFEDRVFGDLGLYVDTLNLQAETGGFTFVAGKFGPGFGRAWDNTPGVYGTDLVEDYELSEQIGFGAAYAFTGAYGTHTLGANVFFADTTVLSDSAFTRRGRTYRSDGGAGNTERLDNFSVTLDGAEFGAMPGFSYHLGYRHLSAGEGDAASESGFVGGVAQELELGGATLGLTAEAAWFDNFGGTLDEALYLSGGLSLVRGPWHGELAATLRRFAFDAGGHRNDRLVQVSGGYGFDNGFDVSLGYALARAEDLDAHVFGVRLSKTFSYSSR